MAAEVSADLNVIHDEDVLRRMWQQTDDFGYKKEIRQRMYKLREQRLKDFYTGDDDSQIITMASRKHAAPTHADSISDQGFMALKSKEIRDSESPTRDIHRRQGDNNYWNTVQESSYSTQGEDGGLIKSYERTSAGTGQSEDGRTQTKLEADERGFTSSKTTESDKGRTVADEQHHDAQIATSSHTKTDNGEAYNYSTSQEHSESKSSVTEAKDQSSAFKSTKWETSSVSSSSSRKVISSSNYGRITSDVDIKALTAGDELDFTTTRFLQDDDAKTSTIRRKNVSQDSKRHQSSEVRYSTEDQTDSSTFIDKEMRNNIKNNLKDIQVDIREDHFGKNDSRRGSSSTYTTEVSSNVDDYITNKSNTSRNVTRETKTDDRSNVVVDQKIMSEIHKLDSFLSTQNTPGTNTPVSPHSVMGEVNWTVVSNTDGEFVYRDERSPDSPGSRSTPIKHPDNLDLPKECTEGQYVTTYNEHYTTKRISQDVSPTHDAFARSLRQTPPGTPRSLSRQSLDRSSPERKTKSSPRSSPDKERRTSVGSYTVEKPTNVRRKTSEVTRQTASSNDSTLKSKRRFSTTQTKAAAKARNSTPGTSPSTSPSRKQKERSHSPSSASDSDASQITYDKRSTTSTYTRSDVVRRNLMDSFEKDSPKKSFTSTETITKSSSRPSSPEKSPTRKSSNASEKKPTGILRKDSRSDSKSTIVTVASNVTEHKVNSSIASRVRDKSPEYSSEGSVSKEIKNTQRKSSPDSSPERSAFTPIKQFRTSPESTSDAMKVTVSESDQSSIVKVTETFINEENLNNQNTTDTVHVDIHITKGSESPVTDKPTKRSSSPEKQSPIRKSSLARKESPTKTRSPSPTKQEVNVTQKESSTRKTSSPREKSPSKINEPSRAHSPTKTQLVRKPSLSDRSSSPKKDERPISPTKGVSRKPSLPTRSPSPPKHGKSRSPSPSKETITTSTSKTVVTRRSSLKKDSSYDAPTKNSSRRSTPSPVKDYPASRSPSPKKESPVRRTSSPNKSPSPQRGNKRSRQESSSPSVSPCSSPERVSERKSERTKVVRKTSGSKISDSETVRSTRRSSIPRADQSTTVRKTVETKIEIRSKPSSRIPSSTNKSRIAQSPVYKNVRTDSQTSLDRQSTTKSTYSTTINRSVDKSKESAKKVPQTKKTVTTTAVISLQKPNLTTNVKQTTTAASRATTYKRTPSKEITPKKGDTNNEKKPMVTTTTKRVASRTNTPKSKPSHAHDEVDRLTKQHDGVENVQSQAFIEQLRKDEITIHGYKDETINIEIEDNDLENETRPDLFPETEDDEETQEQQDEDSVEPTQHISEKTINVDSKRKAASQFMVTIKKPTTTTPTKVGAKPITTRSSSGPVKGSPHSSVKTTSQNRQTSTVTTKRQVTSSVQKADSMSMIRTTSDKNVAKNATQRRQMSKPEMSTTKVNQQNIKLTGPKHVAETGIASKNVTTPKSATVKRVASNKKKPESPDSSSSSEDEGDNIPSVVTPNRQEQQYIEELEEMRRNEEMEYASKLTATTNQENQLLSVIVQHPKSSRESSPDFSNRSQPYCTVSDDGGATPRYADLISEPEDVEVFNPNNKPRFENIKKQPRVEQVTDLDEESEAEDFKLNVSVADRARHFIEASQNHIAQPIREEPESPIDSSKNVLKAKNMFETIAKNQTAPPAPGNKPVDFLSRPSVFEARRGQTAPKPLPSDTFPSPSEYSPDQIQRRASINVDSTAQEFVEDYEDHHYENIHTDEIISQRSPSPDVVRDSPTLPEKKPDNQRPSPTEKSSILKQETFAKQPNETPKANVTPRVTKKELPTDQKKPDTAHKPKPFEKTISAVAEISSKRAFFERKAQAQNSSVKETKSYVPPKERKPLTDYIQNKENIRGSSPTRKTSQTTTFIEAERKSSRVSPERRVSTPSPVKERKPSQKSESPERRISLTKSVKERRSSFTKEDDITTQISILQKKDSFSKTTERKISPSRSSPERRAPITEKNFPDHNSRPVQKTTPLEKVPTSPVKDRKPSFTRESPERVPQRKSSRSSPERAAKSPDRASPSPKNEKEPAELSKAGKFGVTLRRTSSTTSAGTPRRPSIPGESQEIEDVNDVELLEIMMEKAVGYEQRRRIRAQIRVAKKAQETHTKTTTVRQKSPTRSPTRDYKVTQEPVSKAPAETKKVESRRPSSPTKSVSVETKRITTKTTTENVRKSPERQSPERVSPTPRAASPQRKESVPEQKSPGYQRPTESFRRTSKTETTEVSSTVRSGKSSTLVETGVDSITSSYGVGPTDENGRPLFGLRALRRTNTNKQLTDEVTVPEVKKKEEVLSQEPVCDARGRPLFGGLKALRTATANTSTTTTTTTTRTTAATTLDQEEDLDDMPEQNGSTQLRELVQRHEKVVRETNGPQDQPRQKPKARLRDSFILQEEDQTSVGQMNSLNRGVSLKSLIQKHETIATNGGAVRSEMESSHTVVTSRSHVSSDGSVSHTRDVVQGEMSAKNGEEPVGKVTRTQYSYQNAGGDDKGVSRVTTTTTPLGRRTSGPSITEIEDGHDVTQRKSSLKSTKRSSITEEVSGRRSVETVRKGSLRRSPSEDEDSTRRNERVSHQTDEEEVIQKVTASRVSAAAQKFASPEDSKTKSRFTSTTTRQTETRTKTASPTLRRQKSSEEESSGEEKRKTIVRGDSVRALQHKFQQATENGVNSAPRSQAPRAGLILRTSSFNTSQDHNTVSSTLKQSTNLSAEKKSRRGSPENDVTSARRDSQDSRRDSLAKNATDITSRRESVTKEKDGSTTTRVTETTTSSFLDNTSRVTGVQDILTRMRNADLVSESGDTEADREARALLNKFLGASVILQGMEQGMRAGGAPDMTPGSAALVRTVEKQRVATTKQKEEDIDNIWDEQVLKTLLERCTDYEGRRTIRARLRTVMAEHKACADLVALTGDNASQHAETETKQVTMSNDGGSVTRTEVHTRTSTNRLTKANSVSSPFAKFRQLERQNSAPSVGQAGAPLFKITDPRVARSASSIKDRLLSWVQAQTREYKNIQIENFSTSWNNGLAFCALIHHFCPNAFDYDKLTPEHRRHNFELAFRVAEEEADIAPLLDVEDMVVMRRPDWKCVFTYVQSVYRRFHSTPEAVRC